jgi:hypothetical protein
MPRKKQGSTSRPAEQKEQIVKLVRQRTDQPIVYYSNDVTVNHTKWDVQMHFGQLITPEDPDRAVEEGRVVIRQGVTVVMSREHAEAFRNALTQHLAKGLEGSEAVMKEQA